MICYNCKKAMPPSAAKCPSCGQEPYVLFREGTKSAGRRLDGCIFGEPSPKEFRAIPQAGTLPPRVDLRDHCSPVEDQGQIGSCTANAVIGALEYRQRKEGRAPIDLSRMFVYFNARRMAGRVAIDSGAQISEAMASALAYGAPPEAKWPYDPWLFAQEPPHSIFEEAKRHQAPEYARVDKGDGTLGALARGFPVVFGIRIPMRCYQEAGDTGVIPEPRAQEINQMQGGGHAMLIVGFDREQRTYLIRNSWGTGWGDRGYCRMPFDVMHAHSRPEDFWIVGSLEKSGDFKVTRPSLEKPVEGSVAGMAKSMREQIRADLKKDLSDATKEIRDRLKPGPRG